MKYEFEVDGKKFNVIFDIDELLKDFSKSDFITFYEPESFVKYGNIPEYGDPYMTETEYLLAVNDYIESIKALDNKDKLKSMVEKWPKKKNGYLNGRNVDYLCESDVCRYICEWHNTWIYDTVKAVARDEKTIEIISYEKTDTPG